MSKPNKAIFINCCNELLWFVISPTYLTNELFLSVIESWLNEKLNDPSAPFLARSIVTLNRSISVVSSDDVMNRKGIVSPGGIGEKAYVISVCTSCPDLSLQANVRKTQL